MTDYRSMYDRDYIGAWDLPDGKDAVVIISRVEAATLNNGKTKNKRPVVFMQGKEKGFVCNKTNGAAIAGMYGNDISKWIGKPIALYRTTTSVGAEVRDCIRVRPTPPQPRNGKSAPEPGANDEPDMPEHLR
jgi:hypothetical protein